MRRRWLLALAILAVAALAAAGLAYEGYRRVHAPGPLAEATNVVVAPGSGVAAIARQLAAGGVVDSPWLFRLAAQLGGKARALKAGEYAFPAGVSIREAIAILESGRTVARRLTVPEGLTTAQVLVLVGAAEGLRGPLPEPPPAEGSLLPETYYYRWGDSRAEIVARMRTAMDRALEELWPGRAADLPLRSPEEAVILASIVEKETAVPQERALIAGVFVNRLSRGMRLQSDPTVAYALTEGRQGLERSLTRADWQVDSPYNTYRNDGLPPGPIANPGRAALAAVLQPSETAYLYFVADGNGGHAFAKTLAEHNRNVAKWRQRRDGVD